MGVCLGKSTDSSETRGSVPIADRPSVHCVPVIECVGACPRRASRPSGTHKERPQTRIALAQEVYPSAVTETSSVCMTDDRGESQRPSGPRPEGRWCSIELSCDRGQLPLVPHHRGRLTIHPSCMPRLTLADHLSRQTDRHESFDHARRIAARRCSTSASMCGSRATQREQRCGDGEGRDCSPPRTAAVL